MAQYRARIKGFDGEVLRQADEIFDFEGKPGKWMIPLEPEKPKAESSSVNAFPMKKRRGQKAL